MSVEYRFQVKHTAEAVISVILQTKLDIAHTRTVDKPTSSRLESCSSPRASTETRTHKLYERECYSRGGVGMRDRCCSYWKLMTKIGNVVWKTL